MSKAKPFDLLAKFGKFGLERKLALTEAETRAAFGLYVAEAVDHALADPALLNGQRAEAMFEAMLTSLGDFRLVKPEDDGRIASNEPLRVPDVRIVLTSGVQRLVEVENIYIADPSRQRRKVMTREYRQQLKAYSSETAADLKLAIFWARWSIWTLVARERLADASGDVVVDMAAAQANELDAIGDRAIGTRPPLRLWMSMDPDRTRSIGEDSQVMVVIGRVAIYCGQDEITDPTEQQIA